MTIDGDELFRCRIDEFEEDRAVYLVVKNFEDLISWQRARELASIVYRLTRETALRSDFGLRDQMQRAAVSIMSNIAEGHERGSSLEYARFLSIAKGSCAELRSQYYLALDAGYIDRAAFDDGLRRTRELGRIIGGLRASIMRHLDQR